MRNRHLKPSLFVVIALLAFSSPATSQEPSAAGMVPVHIVITAEARHGAQEPDLNREDVTVYLGRTRTQVADWAPLRGEHAGLELFLLLDDSSDVSLGSQLEDLRQFILLQPPTTLIGIGYMRDGGVDTVQNFTADHLQAAKALRLPLGTLGAFASPYLSLSDLLKRWPESPLRHEVLMITDGIDRFGGVGPANPYVDTAIEQVQKAGVLVHSIFASGVGHFGRMQWPVYWGQNYLSEIANETGLASVFSRIRNSRFLCPVSPGFESTSESSIPTYVSRQAREKTGIAESAGQEGGSECGVGRSDESLRSGWIVAFGRPAKGSSYDDY
jgi:hypothetical protein